MGVGGLYLDYTYIDIWVTTPQHNNITFCYIYIVLGIIRNTDMSSNKWKDVHRFYVNTTVLYRK